MTKPVQAKYITVEEFLAVVDRVQETEKRWTHLQDLEDAFRERDIPRKVIRAKAAALIRRGIITGCACGCRGDFERFAGAPGTVPS